MKENNNLFDNANIETNNVLIKVNQNNYSPTKGRNSNKRHSTKKGKKKIKSDSNDYNDQTPPTNENIKVKKFEGTKRDNFIENNINIRNIINSALFS